MKREYKTAKKIFHESGKISIKSKEKNPNKIISIKGGQIKKKRGKTSIVCFKVQPKDSSNSDNPSQTLEGNESSGPTPSRCV